MFLSLALKTLRASWGGFSYKEGQARHQHAKAPALGDDERAAQEAPEDRPASRRRVLANARRRANDARSEVMKRTEYIDDLIGIYQDPPRGVYL